MSTAAGDAAASAAEIRARCGPDSPRAGPGHLHSPARAASARGLLRLRVGSPESRPRVTPRATSRAPPARERAPPGAMGNACCSAADDKQQTFEPPKNVSGSPGNFEERCRRVRPRTLRSRCRQEQRCRHLICEAWSRFRLRLVERPQCVEGCVGLVTCFSAVHQEHLVGRAHRRRLPNYLTSPQTRLPDEWRISHGGDLQRCQQHICE